MGLYKGFVIHVLLEGLGRGWYMLTYETMKRNLYPNFAEGGRDKSNIPLHKRMMAGACAGVVGWTSIYPLDVVRSRIMAQRQPLYSGALDCAAKTYREGGIPIFFRGIKFSLVRAAPVAACVLPTYDLFYKLFAELTLNCKAIDE
jgi:solute carrier family 25 (mitochondrial carnitine/acylcarnitine transporter), member 20/29